jgi:hypothetical protein
MEPHRQSPWYLPHGTSMDYPPTHLGAVALRRASAKASEGYPPPAKSAEAVILEAMNNSDIVYAFIDGQSPRFSA